MKRSLVININKLFKILLYIFLVFPFFKPRSILNDMSKIYNIMIIVIAAIMLLVTIKKKTISKMTVYIISYLIVLFLVTLLYNGDVENCIQSSIEIISLALVIDYGLKNDTSEFLRGFSILLYILVLYNFYTILKFPNGLYVDSNGYADNWFLGFKNIHILFILPAITINFINSYFHYGKISKSCILLLIISFLSLIFVNSSTSLIGLFIISIFLLFQKLFIKSKKLNIKNYFLVNMIAFFGIVIFKLQNIFSFLIVDILKKDITLTNRIYIWDDVMKLISKKPLFGYGLETSSIRLNKTISHPSLHAHNQILEIFYKTGIIGAILFALILIESIKKIYKNNDNIISKFLSVTLFAWFIMMLTEAYAYEYFMYYFVICYNIDYIIKNSKNNHIYTEKKGVY